MERWNYSGGNVLLLLDTRPATGTAASAARLLSEV